MEGFNISDVTISMRDQFYAFNEVAGGCYYIEKERTLSWTEAREHCQAMSGDGGPGDLAIFPSCDAFNLFTGHLGFNAPVSTFWIGAHIEFGINNWRWVSGLPLATGVPFWAYRQGHGSNQNCAAMDNTTFYQLSDFPCEEPKNYVCQVPLASKRHATKEQAAPKLICPHNSIQVGSYCYWFSDTTKTWFEAEDFCRNNFNKNAGELFSPSTCDEFTQMAHHLEVAERDKDHWVGASDVSGYQEWFWVSGYPVPEGTPFWATSEPDDHFSSNYCGLMSQEKRFYMEDESCSRHHYYICKLHVTEATEV
ncbi:Lithostathine-1-beta [Chionoecetes opilio]|uniref:Lithostathine-1-beta n=1 Tax=Chionoecetes opilio TaxID=41210 RepID=A0A8J5CZK7_CHIOP|nr:Lithostathine-1-beta [Chionoecetes opilio]